MPKTYHDAILITRYLGIRYLWIDAICILQDDPDDWERESAKMQGIYMGSYCTIAATGSTSADEGILNERPAELWDTGLYTKSRVQPEIRYFNRIIQPASPSRDRTVSGHFNTRGWIFQEMLLSPRILHFTAHCLYFDCRSGTVSELDFIDESRTERSVKSYLKDTLLDPTRLSPQVRIETWWDVLETYTMRTLTNEQDRLPAISGIANRIAMATKDRYVAGLWQDDLVEGLQWVVATEEDYGSSTPWTRISSRRPQSFISPSWSWASVIGPIKSAKKSIGKWETNWEQEIWSPALHVLGVEVDLAHEANRFGHVTFGRLRVRGRLRPARLTSANISTSHGLILAHEASDGARKKIENAFRFDVSDEFAENSQRQDLWCLEIYRYIKGQPSFRVDARTMADQGIGDNFEDGVCFHALVLKRSDAENMYRRVGFAKLTNKLYFDDSQEQVIEII